MFCQIKLLFLSKQSGGFAEITVRYNGLDCPLVTSGNMLTNFKYLIQSHFKNHKQQHSLGICGCVCVHACSMKALRDVNVIDLCSVLMVQVLNLKAFKK